MTKTMEHHKRYKNIVFDETTKRWKLLRKTSRKLKDQCWAKYCSGFAGTFMRKGKLYQRPYCFKCTSRVWDANNRAKRLYTNLKASAKRREIPFDLTYSQFYLFCLDTNYFERIKNNAASTTVDRIRNNEGYTINNIQVLTRFENSMKDITDPESHRNSHSNDDPF